MAAPIVAGALANIISMAKSRGKVVSNADLKAWLRGFGSPREDSFSEFVANGKFLNLDTLVSHAINEIPKLPNANGTTTPPPSPTPGPELGSAQG